MIVPVRCVSARNGSLSPTEMNRGELVRSDLSDCRVYGTRAALKKLPVARELYPVVIFANRLGGDSDAFIQLFRILRPGQIEIRVAYRLRDDMTVLVRQRYAGTQQGDPQQGAAFYERPINKLISTTGHDCAPNSCDMSPRGE